MTRLERAADHLVTMWERHRDDPTVSAQEVSAAERLLTREVERTRDLDGLQTLKSWPEFFQAILDRRKTSDFRITVDRNFAEDDVLRYQEWDPHMGDFTGRRVDVRVTNVLHGPIFHLAARDAVLSIQVIEGTEVDDG